MRPNGFDGVGDTICSAQHPGPAKLRFHHLGSEIIVHLLDIQGE